MSDLHAFGDLLLELRVGRGLSQEELAADAQVSVRAISDLERGVTRRPRRDTIRALAEALGLPAGDRTAFERLARQAPAPFARRSEGQRIDLPAPATSLVGRADDLAALTRLVRSPARLVTITGSGGVGKTRLAIEVAWRVTPSFLGVHLVDLSTLRVADHVPAAIATAVGLPRATVSTVAALAVQLGQRARLLVLDSAEHVPALAVDLARLLSACPEITVLVTSRGPLRLQGEHLWPLSPLALPTSDTGAARLDNPALRLLVERTAAIRPGFTVTPANVEVLVRLCRRLDGLPLAIELAAARLRTREPAELLSELDLAGLRSDTVDVPDRHQSLHATLWWTVDQLDPVPRRLFGVLSTFPGGATVPRLRQVLAGAGLDAGSLTGAVSVLADAHLVAVVDRRGQACLTMLDTIREVATDVLRDDEEAAVRAAHAACFLDLVRAAESPDAVDAELDNVRAALDWGVTVAPQLLAPPVVAAVGAYLIGRGHFGEAYRILTAIADRAPDPTAQAHARCGAGIAANENGEPELAVPLGQSAARAYQDLDDPAGRCTALALLGNAHKALGEYGQAQDTHETGLALARTLADPRALTVALNNLGTVAEDLGDYAKAESHYAESLAIKARHGDDRGVAVARNNLGGLAAELGDYVTARDHLARAAEEFRARGEDHALSFSLAMLAQARLGCGEPEPAQLCAEEALRAARRVEFGHGAGLALARLGDLALHRGDPPAARDSYRQALEHPIGLPELIRTLERLAAATVPDEPEQARLLLAEADRLRRSHALPPSPTARAVIDAVRAGLVR